MFLRSLLQTWLQNAAKAKVRDAVVQAAQGQPVQPSPPPPANTPKTCHFGIVFALGIESGCLEDLLQGMVTTRGKGFVLRGGGLSGRRVALILSGPGRTNAARAAEVLIDGHQPARVISAGFAGGLCPALKRTDILIANRLLSSSGSEIALDLPTGLSAAVEWPGVHCGPLLTSDRVVRTPRERQSLFQRCGAMAVDMETFAVAAVCRQRDVPFSAIRAINDTADETLPRDVENLLAQKSGAAQLGAALGAIWRRPASAKDLYQLRENALLASLRLAKFLAEVSFE